MRKSLLCTVLLTAASGSAQAYSLGPPQDFSVGTEVRHVAAAAIGDVDGDGRDDLALSTDEWHGENRLFVLLRQGDGTLSEAIEVVFPPGQVARLLVSDLDGDGRGEVIAGHMGVDEGQSGGITISRWLDGGLSTVAYDPGEAVGALHVAIADVDRDGNADVFTQGHTPTNSDARAVVYFGDGQGGVGRIVEHSAPVFATPVDLVAADMDGDGHRDLVLRNQTNEDYINVLYNDGSDDLAPPVAILLLPEGVDYGGGYGVAIGDYNDDGRADIATKSHQNYYDYIAVLLQGENGQFAAAEPLAHVGTPQSIQAADMDGDGRDDLVAITGGGRLSLRYQGDTGLGEQVTLEPDTYLTHPSLFSLATGDIAGDGCMDAVLANGTSGFTLRTGVGCRPIETDFNGDDVSDVLWRHATSGADAIWLGADADAPQPMRSVRNVDWEVVATGDFDGDDVSDVFWRNRSTGANALWPRAAPSTTPVRSITRTAWQVVGAGDFDGDGRDDLFWRDAETGANAIWPSAQPGDVPVMGVRNLDWMVAGIGDFDGDRMADVLWRNSVTGHNVVWRHGDYGDQQSVRGAAGDNWQIAGVADFDGDHRDDVLWRNTATGANMAWRGADAEDVLLVTGVRNQAWEVVATGDYDGDGRDDLFWRNAGTGANVIWNGADYDAQRAVHPVSNPDWQVVPLR